MSLIKYPVIKYKSSFSLFLEYANTYNLNKPLRNQLRPQHAKLYARILTLLSRQIYGHNKLFEDTPQLRIIDTSKPILLHTNRKALSWVENTLKINENTVYRQLNRLIEANVIVEKVNHGSQMNFELYINPDLLLISDLNSPDVKPTSNFIKTENKDFSACLNTSFPPEYLTQKEHFNNINIDVNKVSRTRRDEIGKEQERTSKEQNRTQKEHRKIAVKAGESPNSSGKNFIDCNQNAILQTQKEQHSPKAKESKLREHQKAAARWFFWYVMAQIFENRSINPGHLENTLSYVQNNYFTHCYNIKAIENTRKVYKWRIDKAKRTIERHQTNMQWVFPGNYLDLNKKGINPKTGNPYMSFVNTAAWPKKYQQFMKKNHQHKKETADRDLLHKQIRIYLNNPNTSQFKRCESYIRKNIPHLMNDFLTQFITR